MQLAHDVSPQPQVPQIDEAAKDIEARNYSATSFKSLKLPKDSASSVRSWFSKASATAEITKHEAEALLKDAERFVSTIKSQLKSLKP